MPAVLYHSPLPGKLYLRPIIPSYGENLKNLTQAEPVTKTQAEIKVLYFAEVFYNSEELDGKAVLILQIKLWDSTIAEGLHTCSATELGKRALR